MNGDGDGDGDGSRRAAHQSVKEYELLDFEVKISILLEAANKKTPITLSEEKVGRLVPI